MSEETHAHEIWQNCLDQLARELPEQQFNTWIKPLVAQVSPDAGKLTLLVANRFKLDWIRAQYSTRISSLLEKTSGQTMQLELAIPVAVPARPRPAPHRRHCHHAPDHCSHVAHPRSAGAVAG